MNAESDDLGGLEIEFHPDGNEPFAFVVFCQGWCSQYYRVPVAVHGNRFDLQFGETYVDERGAPADTITYRVRGHLAGTSLVGDLQAKTYREHFQLKRRKTRFGLNVARPAPKL